METGVLGMVKNRARRAYHGERSREGSIWGRGASYALVEVPVLPAQEKGSLAVQSGANSVPAHMRETPNESGGYRTGRARTAGTLNPCPASDDPRGGHWSRGDNSPAAAIDAHERRPRGHRTQFAALAPARGSNHRRRGHAA